MKLREAKNQAEDVVQLILRYNFITSQDLHSAPYYISNSTNAVREARLKGYPIQTRTIYKTNRRGNKIDFAQWYIKEEDRQKAIDKYNKVGE